MKVKVKRQGATTIVTVIDAQRGITAQGQATCAEGDVYSPVVGEHVALYRALGNFRSKLTATGKTQSLAKAEYERALEWIKRGDVPGVEASWTDGKPV